MIEKDEIINNKIESPKIEVQRGIYFLIQENKIVYIGSSNQPNERIVGHLATGKIIFDSFYIIKVNKDDDLRIIEAKYIFKYSPKYNKMLPASKYFKTIGMTSKKTSNQKIKIDAAIIGNKVYVKNNLSQNIKFKIKEKKKYEKYEKNSSCGLSDYELEKRIYEYNKKYDNEEGV